MRVFYLKNKLYFLAADSLKLYLNRSKRAQMTDVFKKTCRNKKNKKLSSAFTSNILYFQIFWII